MLLCLWKGAVYTENGQSVRFHGNGYIQKVATKEQERKSHLGRCESNLYWLEQ
ncbi:Uncharacterised protein [Mycobacterium tuberculosis]|nr:Uncharacterised protein [Mycobacterium tuberculosis]